MKYYLNRRSLTETDNGPVLRLTFLSECGKHEKYACFTLGVGPRDAKGIAQGLQSAGKILEKEASKWSMQEH
jgi:hypothetical protein